MIFDESNTKHADLLLAVMTAEPCSVLTLRARLFNSYGLTAVQPAEVWRVAIALSESNRCGHNGRDHFWKGA